MTPLETARAFLSAMEKMDYDAALPLIADEAEYINGASPAVQGPDGVRQTLEPFFAPLEANEFIIQREAVQGTVVFIERLDRHLAGHGWFELPVTGVFEVNDGKITFWREYFDLAVIQDDIARIMAAG